METFLLTVHIIAVAAWLGTSVSQFVVTPAMQKIGGAPAAAWMRQTVRLARTVASPAAVLILITGVWMVLREAVFEFEQTFVTLGFLTVIVGMALGMRVFAPRGREIAALHDAGEDTRAGEARKKLTVFALAQTALVVVTIWAMVEKIG